MPWIQLATLDQLPPGSLIEVERGPEIYALCNTEGSVRALSGVCPHQGGPLGEGTLESGVITCPWHMWEFDSSTGACVFDEDVKVSTYPVRVEGNGILVDLPEPAS